MRQSRIKSIKKEFKEWKMSSKIIFMRSKKYFICMNIKYFIKHEIFVRIFNT